MNWIRLTPESVGSFIVLLLSLVAIAYMLSLRDKSKQTWALSGYLLLLVCFACIGFLQQAGPSDWLSWLFPAKLISFMLMQTALLNFACLFLNEPDRHTQSPAFLLALVTAITFSTLLVLGGLGFQLIRLPFGFRRLLMLIMILFALAPAWVFLARAVAVAGDKPGHSSDGTGGRNPGVFAKLRLHWLLLRRPPDDISRVLRNFGLLTLLPLIPFVAGVLVREGGVPVKIRDLLLLIFGSAYLFGFVTLYLSYAEERTSIHAKLVGLSLVTALLVLQVIGGIMFGSERLTFEAGARSLDGHLINFTPDSTGGYQVSHNLTIGDQPVDQQQGLVLPEPGPVELEFDFPFYGKQWQSVYVAESGFLTFGGGPQPHRVVHFRNMLGYEKRNLDMPRIMVLDADLVLAQRGSISYSGNADVAVFSWHSVVQRHSNEYYSFQVKLYPSGNLEFIYQDTGELLDTGVIGISPGGESTDMQPLNLFEMTSISSSPGFGIWENLTARYRNHAHRQLSLLFGVILGTTVLIILVFPFFYRVVLTRPMAQLLDGLRLVDQGNLNTTISVKSKNELGILAIHFNRMTTSLRRSELTLRQHAEQLEVQVQQRTSELAEQNLLLERQWRQLQEIDAAKSRLFANVSHEFRTPLTLTLGSLEDIHSGMHGQQSPDVLEQLELAMRNARRVLQLINQMLDIARIEGNELSLQLQRVDLNEFLTEIGQAFVPLAERKQIAFDIELPDQAVQMDGDPEQLEKIFTNLLSNAFKFTPEGGAVRLMMSIGSDEMLGVSVRDNGPGISADQLPHVFERFYQASGPHIGFSSGSGIGLALVRELVELHQGQVMVDSEVGFGSTFTVELPSKLQTTQGYVSSIASIPDRLGRTEQQVQDLIAESDCTKTGQEVSPDNAGVDRTTILVVDDNPEIRSYIHKHLNNRYRVVEAEDGRDALALARDLMPDLVVSDVMMPNMDGSALCNSLKQNPELDYLPVILLTAKAGEADKLVGLNLGADDYLAKPFSMPELITRIDNLIESRRRLKARYTRPVQLAPKHIQVKSADQSFLQRLRDVIEQHLGDPEFSVEQLASSVGQSRGNLHRRLRAIINQTPSDVIRNIRLQRGADLLAQHAGSVSEIAYSVGFRAVAHFSASFRDKYGMPPSAYAASI